MLTKFYLKQGKGRKAEKGHPWIYTDEIEGYDGEYTNGDIIEVYNSRGRFIGKGFINDSSKISIRLMTRNQEDEIGYEFLRMRLKNAFDYRSRVIDTTSCRDGLRRGWTSFPASQSTNSEIYMSSRALPSVLTGSRRISWIS